MKKINKIINFNNEPCHNHNLNSISKTYAPKPQNYLFAAIIKYYCSK